MICSRRTAARRTLGLLLLVAPVASAPLFAQTTRVPLVRAPYTSAIQGVPLALAPEKGWHFSATLYGWLPSISGDVGVGPVASHVDISVSELLDHLNFAAMGYVDARNGPIVLGFDAIYAALGAGDVIVFRGDTGSAHLDLHQTILQPVAGYSWGNEYWTLDLLGGIRYWRLSADLQVDHPITGHQREHSRSRSWVDATLGVRSGWVVADRWNFIVGGDGGGGGSQSTWQAYGSAGYDFASHWMVGLAYRSLWVDYDRDNFLWDVVEHGVLLSVTYRFGMPHGRSGEAP